MYTFGPGVLIGTPSGAAQTPINFGLVQSVTIDETINLKSLFGQNQRALAIGAGTRKTTGKATMARISGKALGALYYGIQPTTGGTATAIAEAGTVPATSTYIITVANSATWTQDQGVYNALTGVPLKRVASGPTTGQYSVSAGVYTFAAADASLAVYLNYNYTLATPGQGLIITNPLLGNVITFGVNWYMQDPTTNLGMTCQLYNCVASKNSFGSKLEDFTMPEIDFECYVNAAGNLGGWQWSDSF